MFQAFCGIPENCPNHLHPGGYDILWVAESLSTHEPRSWKGLIRRTAWNICLCVQRLHQTSQGVRCGSNQTNKRNKQTKREVDTHTHTYLQRYNVKSHACSFFVFRPYMNICIYKKSLSLFSAVGRVAFFHTVCLFFKWLFSHVGTVLFLNAARTRSFSNAAAGSGTPFVFKRHRRVWDTVRFQTPPLGVGHRSFPNATAGCGTPFVFKRHRWVWDTVRFQTPTLDVGHRS